MCAQWLPSRTGCQRDGVLSAKLGRLKDIRLDCGHSCALISRWSQTVLAGATYTSRHAEKLGTMAFERPAGLTIAGQYSSANSSKGSKALIGDVP